MVVWSGRAAEIVYMCVRAVVATCLKQKKNGFINITGTNENIRIDERTIFTLSVQKRNVRSSKLFSYTGSRYFTVVFGR